MYKSIFSVVKYGIAGFLGLVTILQLVGPREERSFISVFDKISDHTVLYGYMIGFSLVLVAKIILIRRRGPYNWNVTNIQITIDYQEKDGSIVLVKRSQIMYPNRDGVRLAAIHVSSGPENGAIEPYQEQSWNARSVIGRSPLGRLAPNCNVSKQWLREARGFWLYIQPEGSAPFPYPKSGILRPRQYPKNYFHLKIEGVAVYRNSYMEDEEYFQLTVGGSGRPLVNSVVFELMLPCEWAECPEVTLFRENKDELKKQKVAEIYSSDKEKRKFISEVRDCKDETLRLDWRRQKLHDEHRAPTPSGGDEVPVDGAVEG